MIKGLKSYMAAHGYRQPDDSRGKLVSDIKSAPELTLYDGYAEIINPGLSAPCKSACPQHIPVQALMRKISAEDYDGAWKLLAAAAPDNEPCSGCEAPCEKVCIKARSGKALSIREVIRFVREWGLGKDTEKLSPETNAGSIYLEAERCLRCGCGEGCGICKQICCEFAPFVKSPDTLEIDKDACLACGMCFHRCPKKNIRMTKIERR